VINEGILRQQSLNVYIRAEEGTGKWKRAAASEVSGESMGRRMNR
jgi:hypothetical protein